MNSQETNMSTMIQNVCVCFTTTRRCILCTGCLSWISVSPIFHQIGLYLNSSEWSSFAHAHSAQFNLSFITSVFSSTVTEWQLAMELVINYIAHMLSDISLPSALQISSYQEKKKLIIKIWTVSNQCNCLYINNHPEKSYFLHCLCLFFIANVISFSTAETMVY